MRSHVHVPVYKGPVSTFRRSLGIRSLSRAMVNGETRSMWLDSDQSNTSGNCVPIVAVLVLLYTVRGDVRGNLLQLSCHVSVIAVISCVCWRHMLTMCRPMSWYFTCCLVKQINTHCIFCRIRGNRVTDCLASVVTVVKQVTNLFCILDDLWRLVPLEVRLYIAMRLTRSAKCKIQRFAYVQTLKQ